MHLRSHTLNQNQTVPVSDPAPRSEDLKDDSSLPNQSPSSSTSSKEDSSSFTPDFLGFGDPCIYDVQDFSSARSSFDAAVNSSFNNDHKDKPLCNSVSFRSSIVNSSMYDPAAVSDSSSVFDGKNFKEWQGLMLWKLRLIGVITCIEDREQYVSYKALDAEGRSKKEWENYTAMNIKAACTIMGCVGSRVRTNLLRFEFAYEIWSYLTEFYDPKLSSLKCQARKSLHALNFNMRGNMTGFIANFDKCITEYRSQGGVVSDEEEIEWFLAALPPFFHTVVDWFDALPAANRNIIALKTKCIDRHKAYRDYYDSNNSRNRYNNNKYNSFNNSHGNGNSRGGNFSFNGTIAYRGLCPVWRAGGA